MTDPLTAGVLRAFLFRPDELRVDSDSSTQGDSGVFRGKERQKTRGRE